MILLVSLRVNLHDVLHLLRDVPARVFLIGAFGYLGSLALSSLRWRCLVRAGGMSVTFSRVFTATLVGSFANAFGLGTVGGDLLRAALLCGASGASNAVALASVAADRLLGLGVLAAIGVVAASFVVLPGEAHSYIFIAAAVVVAGIMLWFSIPHILKRLEHLPRVGKFIGQAEKAFPRDIAVLLQVVALALAFHIMQLGVLGCMLRAMDINVPWLYLFAALPIANIVTTLPLSWMGVGLREGLYVMLFTPTYMSPPVAVLCAALWLFSMMAASVVGGVLAVLSGDITMLKAIPSAKSFDAKKA